VADGNRAPRGLKRWLIALVRRAALAALRPELNELERASAESRGGLERLSRDAAALAGTASVLGADLQRETAAREETRRHLDTRLDEQLSEIARLRDERIPDCEHTQAQLHEAARALQAELERLRDERLPQAQADLTQVHGGLAALQGELERLRDERLPQAEADLARAQQALAVQQGEVERLRDERLPQAEADAGRAQQALTALQTALELVRDERLPKTDADVGRAQQALEALQAELELVRDERLPKGERDLAHLQTALERVQALAEEVRDVRLPALSARCDALVERLYEELAVTAGLAQRLAQHEPLQLTLAPETERQLPTAITAASRAFLDGFRGTREEILGRVQEYVPLLREAAPVLDLGCGRGELLDALQTAGIEARGVDCDPALVKACRRRGLAAEVGDALTTLRGQPGESLGAVAALHLFEHLPAPEWMSIIEAAGAALCRGGLLLVECPNPDSLRVGAGLFWSDPTHRAPLHPAALAFTLRTLGLEVVETRYLHPFAPEEALARPDQTPEVAELARRLDHLLSGPRDFLVIGRKPL
jgi:O-antigen chain-terminating methyltransferase